MSVSIRVNPSLPCGATPDRSAANLVCCEAWSVSRQKSVKTNHEWTQVYTNNAVWTSSYRANHFQSCLIKLVVDLFSACTFERQGNAGTGVFSACTFERQGNAGTGVFSACTCERQGNAGTGVFSVALKIRVNPRNLWLDFPWRRSSPVV